MPCHAMDNKCKLMFQLERTFGLCRMGECSWYNLLFYLEQTKNKQHEIHNVTTHSRALLDGEEGDGDGSYLDNPNFKLNLRRL